MAENLEFGIGLNLDQDSWKKDWARIEKQIQDTIDSSQFKIKISGAEGLEQIKQQLLEIQEIQKQSMKPLTSYQAGKLDIARQTAQTEAQARANEINARSQERVAKMAIQTQKARLGLNEAIRKGTSDIKAQTSALQSQLGVMNGMKQFLNSYVSILGAYRVLKNIKQITSEFELQRVSLRAITQDAQFADNLFAKIKTTAVESPFSTKDLVTYTKQLAAYRIENEELYDTLQMLADISAGLKVGVDRLILAYGQVKAASVLRGTELRQFTEAGIPLVEELARKFSQLRGEIVSTGEVFDLISTRQVPFEMVAEIFKEMTSEGGRFFEIQKKQSESLYGVFENLVDAWQISFDEIGQSNRGLLMTIGKTATGIAKNFQTILDVLTPLAYAFGVYKIAVIATRKASSGLAATNAILAKAEYALTGAIAERQAVTGLLVGTMRAARAANNKYAISIVKAAAANNIFSKSFYMLKAAMLANPVTAVLSAVTLAISAFVTAWKRYLNSLSSADNANKEVAKRMEEIHKPLKEAKDLYDSLSDKIKEQQILINTQEKSLSDLKKIYPDLFSKYKNEEEWKDAVSKATVRQKEAIDTLRKAFPGYFKDLDNEKDILSSIAREWENIEVAMKDVEIQKAMSDLEAYQKKAEDVRKRIEERYERPMNLIFAAIWNRRDKKEAEGLERRIESLKGKISELRGDIDDINKSTQYWLSTFNDLFKGNQLNTDNTFNDAIQATRDLWKGAKEDADKYKNAIESLEKLPVNEERSNQIKSFQQSLSEAEKTIISAEKYAKEFGFTLDDNIKKASNKEGISALRAEFSLIQKIYKEYQDLLKLMSPSSAAKQITESYGNITNIDFLTEEGLKSRLNKLANSIDDYSAKIVRSDTDTTNTQINNLQRWSKAFEDAIKEREGFLAKAKRANGDANYSIGYGFERGGKVKPDDVITRMEADAELIQTLNKYADELDNVLSSYVGLKLTQQQYDVLLDLAYNAGPGLVDKLLKESEGNYQKVGELLKRYATTSKSTGEQLPGLLKRAQARAEQWIAGMSGEMVDALYKISADNIEQLPSYLKMQILKAIGDIDVNAVSDKLERALSQISSQISRQKTAAEFFQKMIGLTGDTELSTRLTLSVTGIDLADGEDIRGQLALQLAEIMSMEAISADVEAQFNLDAGWDTASLQDAIRTGKVSVAEIQNLINKLPDSMGLKSKLQSALNAFVEYNKGQMESLFGIVGQYGDFEDKIKILQSKLLQDQKKVLDAVKPEDMLDIDWEKWMSQALNGLQNQFDQDVAKLSFEELQKKFSGELSNLDAVTVDVLDKMMSELQKILSAGNLDASTLSTVLDLMEQINDVKIDKRPLQEFADAWRDLTDAIRAGDDAAKSSALDRLSKSADKLVGDYRDVENAVSSIVDTATGLAEVLGVTFSDDTEAALDAFKNGISAITTALTAMSAVIGIIEAALAPLLLGALAVGAAFAAIDFASGANTRMANKAIEMYADKIRDLELAYEDLQEAEKDLVGSDWARNQIQQIKNLGEQAKMISRQIEAEKKKGKDTDKQALQDFEDEYRSTLSEMADARRELFEEMAGTGKTDLIMNFANSAVEAYLTFSDATEAMKESFRDMIQNMVAQSVLAKVVEKRLAGVFEAIDAALAGDGEFSTSELQGISNLMQSVMESLPGELESILEQFGWLDDWRDPIDGDLTGIAKGISQASEETVLTLAGYANSILYYQIGLRNDVSAIRAILEGKVAAVTPNNQDSGINVGQLVVLQKQSVAHLQAISNNTAQTAMELRELNYKVDSIISAPGTSPRKVVNTRLT